MKLSLTAILLAFALFLPPISGLYFHIGETERKCFIEEIPDETMVVGNYKVQLYDPRTNGFAPSSPGIGMHVEIRDPDDKIILSKVYSSEGRFTFTSTVPGEHVICLYTNSTKWFSGTQLRVHLDIQVGEHAVDYANVAQKEKLSELQLRVRQLLDQAQSRHYRHLGVWRGLRKIVSEESAVALYKGNGAQMLRIFPYAALQFASYETYRSVLPNILTLNHESHLVKFVSGSLAGLTAVTMTFPLDTIRARLAFQVAGEHVYKGIADTARTITRDEGGVRGLYRGLSPTLVAMVPYSGLTFYCFEVLKHQLLVHVPSACISSDEGVSLSVPAKLLCGAVAGGVAQTAAYPLDVTRRRMQLALMQPDTAKYAAGLLGTLSLIYREDGVVRGLYRGMSVNYLRAVPMVAVTFSMYELLKQSMGLYTGVKISTG